MNRHFPAEFKHLEAWIDWALPTEHARNRKRSASSLEELKAFCAALQPHMEDVIAYMSKIEWGAPLTDEQRELFNLGLTYMEAVIPIDLGWKQTVPADSYPIDRLALTPR